MINIIPYCVFYLICCKFKPISSDDLKHNITNKEATDSRKNNIQKRSIYDAIHPPYHTLDDLLRDQFNAAVDQSEKNSKNSNTTINGTEFCAINIKQLNETHALIIEYKSDDEYEFKSPQTESGYIVILSGKSLHLSCTVDNNFFLIDKDHYGEFVCKRGNIFMYRGTLYNFYDLMCAKVPTFKITDNKSQNGSYIMKIGFEVMKGNYLNVMELFVNEANLSPNYARSTISGIIAGGQDEVTPQEFTDTKANVKQAYDSQRQENSAFRNQLKCLNSQSNKCTYLSEDKNHEFVPALLVHPSSFLYKVGGLTTFLYLNTNPQWPSINEGNWARIQEHIIQLAKGLRTDLEIYTGTYNELKLIDNADEYLEKNIFLNPYEKQEIKHSISIPQYFWKIAYDPVHKEGVVFVTVNNPFIVYGPDYHLCKYSRSKQPNVLMPKGWNPNNVTEGYSYMCDLSDFLRSTNLNIKELKNDNGLLYLQMFTADNSDEASLDEKDDYSEPDTDDYFDSVDCSISVNSLGANKPIPIKDWTYTEFAHFYYPNEQGNILIPEGNVVTFMCPIDNNFKYPIHDSIRGDANHYHKFICNDGEFELDHKEYDLNGLTCENDLSFDIQENDTSIDASITAYWLRFSYVDQKLNLIKIYYDNSISSTLYVQYPIRRSIRGRQELIKTFNREFDDIGCCSGLNSNMNDLYSPEHNYTKFSCYENICEEYQILASRENGYFTPAQLAPPTHFHFKAVANVTFTYLNTRPMWKTIFRGNWARTNEFIYEMIAVLDEEEIMVYSGASGQFEFVSKDRYFSKTTTKVTLDEKDDKLPVPKHFWKFVYNPNTNEGVFFITVNDPLLKIDEYEPICEEVKGVIKPNWILTNSEHGYSYMCRASDILKSGFNAIKLYTYDWKLWQNPSMGLLSISSVPGCSLNINNLKSDTPLPINNWTYTDFAHFYYPNKRGHILIGEGNVVTYMCPENNKFTNFIEDTKRGSANQYHKFVCKEGDFVLEGRKYDLNELTCENNITYDVRENDTSIDSKITAYWIAFSYNDQKLNLLKIFYDNTISSTLYVQYPIRASIIGRQDTVKTLNRDFDEDGCCPGLKAHIAKFYDPAYNYTEFFCVHVECKEYYDLAVREKGYFTPAQLAPPTHFPYQAIANITFAYWNTRPMWKTIHRGNWARTNEFIYQMVGVLEEKEIIVYGGASGRFIFVSEPGFFTDTKKQAYLDVDNDKLPIPKHFWKFVYDPNKNQGVFFITVNDPLFNKYASYKPLCEEVTEGLKPNWSSNHEDGYSYMCKASDILNENFDEIKIWKSDWTPWYDSSIGFLSLSSKENQSKLKTFFAYFGTALVGAAGAIFLLA